MKLEEFLGQKEVAPALAKDYVIIEIDTALMENGKQVADRLRKSRRGGIPWMVILDATGKELITSDGPKGNVGCPVQPHEIEWFLTMLRNTARNLGEEQIAEIEAALRAYAEKLGR